MLPQLRQLILNQPLLLGAVLLISVTVIFWPHPKPTPIAAPIQAEPPMAPIPIPSKTTQDKATAVLELFNPSDQSLTHQLSETSISQQVEQVMATSYVLTHCKLMDADEYRDNFRALIVFTMHSGLATNPAIAEAKVRQLAESAGVTYSLLYAKTDCNSPQLPSLYRQMINWQKIYLHE